MTRIVHTADWHLGARLIDCERQEEHAAFLDWFLSKLEQLRPDLIIVAGDIFDGATPPQEALRLYYYFLSRLSRVPGCQTLVLGGNHDSAATLHAPREVLRALAVRVIASPPADPVEGILEFEHAVVCAVPYLRERDIRNAAPGQSADEIAASIRLGVTAHYRALHTLALARAAERLIIATGHLTTVGSAASPSERTIHIGQLGAIDHSCFDGFSYVALGHIHRPQQIGGQDRVCYAGSPIPLSFAEVDVEKQFRVIDVEGSVLTQQVIPIPVFRPLLRLTAESATLAPLLLSHQAPAGQSMVPWVELTVTDGRSHPDLDRQILEASAGLRLRVLKVLTPALTREQGSSEVATPALALSDLRPEDVFAQRLRRAQIDPESPEGEALALTFMELLSGMHEATTAPREEAAP